MARARQIKPAFFTNEDLVELDPIIRLLFISLWMLADRAGRLEDRPKQIKLKMFPADDLDVDQALNALAGRGFVERYEAEGRRYLQVAAFLKHQRPHHNEQESAIPAPPGFAAAPPQDPPEPGQGEPASPPGSAPLPTKVESPSDQGDKRGEPGGAALAPRTLEPRTLLPDNPAKAGIADDAAIGSGDCPSEPPGPEEPPANVKQLRPVSLEPAQSEPFRLLQVLTELTGFGKDGIARREKDKQAAVAKRLLTDGYTEADVRGCITFLLTEEWRDGIVDLFVVDRQIGKWVAAGRPAVAGEGRSRSNGKANGKLRDYEGTDWEAVKAELEAKKHAKAT